MLTFSWGFSITQRCTLNFHEKSQNETVNNHCVCQSSHNEFRLKTALVLKETTDWFYAKTYLLLLKTLTSSWLAVAQNLGWKASPIVQHTTAIFASSLLRELNCCMQQYLYKYTIAYTIPKTLIVQYTLYIHDSTKSDFFFFLFSIELMM